MTGLGGVDSPVGQGRGRFYAACLRGVGFACIPSLTFGFPGRKGAEVKALGTPLTYADARGQVAMDRYYKWGCGQLEHAYRTPPFSQPWRGMEVWVMNGSGIGGCARSRISRHIVDAWTERVSPFFKPMMIQEHGLRSPVNGWGSRGTLSATCTACPGASTNALGDAFEVIRGDSGCHLAGSEAPVTGDRLAGFAAVPRISTPTTIPLVPVVL